MPVEIQDNIRETEIINLFKLKKTNHNRIGIDAKIKYKNHIFDFEIKSTTMNAISTASPLTLDHIKKWRHQHWLVGVYCKNAKLKHCLYGSPEDMQKWLDYWEEDIKRGLFISDMLVERIDYDMLFEIFGKKVVYTIDDAKYVFKKLFTKSQYNDMMDKQDGFSKKQLLKMFKEHNKTYLYRGANVNNPKIPLTYVKNWKIINCDYHKTLKNILNERITNA